MAGEITIPSTLKTMGVGAFVGRVNNYSTELTAFNVASGNNYFSAVDGVLFDKNQTTLYCYPSKKADTAYVMPSTVVTIKENAMAGLQNLSSLTLNDGLENINAEAFSNSIAIRNLNIPSSVVTIGYRAFSGWTKAQTISVSHTKMMQLCCLGLIGSTVVMQLFHTENKDEKIYSLFFYFLYY